APHGAAVADHVQLERRAQSQRTEEQAAHHQQCGAINQDARTQHAAAQLAVGPAVFHAILGRVADQATRLVYLVHHRVAGIDAGGAAYAFVLQTLADIDADRAHLHAQTAIDAVAA